MRRTALSLTAALLIVGCASSTPTSKSTPPPAPVAAAPAPAAPATPAFPPPPVTEARPVTEVLHGVTVTDPYRWLEDQQSPETRAWIDRENAYTDTVLKDLSSRDAFAKRFESFLKVDTVGTPAIRNGRYFFVKRLATEDQFSIYMRNGIAGEDIRLIDPAPLSPKHTTSVGIEDVTQDGKVLAYYVREGGADEVEVRFFDVDQRRDTGAILPRARYFGTSVTADRNVYYARHSETGDRVYRRALTGGNETQLFGGEGYGPEKIIGAGTSDDGHYLLISVSHGSAPKKTELYLKDLRNDGPVKTVVNDLDAKSYADIAGDSLIITTNWDAPNQRVMIAPAANPGRANWKELVPENKNAALQAVSLAGGTVFVRYLENVQPRVIGYGLDGKQKAELRFPTLGTLSDLSGSWEQPTAFYRFSSFATPTTTYAYDVPTGKSSEFVKLNVPVNPADFTTQQAWFTSKDGTRVPMFIFYKKGLAKNGANPTLLTGYGGFNASQLPGLSATAVTWAEAGGVYALVNLRGGGEFGEAWHTAGMLDRKQNVFEDFYAAARYLIDQHYTSPQHLGISGGSNGGLLVTAAETQHPELFGAVVVQYPLVDMLRFHKFLVGSYWVPEYGSADDPKQFPAIYAYSPYQHVVKGTKYPATLFITGDADTRVAPLHARKMTALLQAETGGTAPILIRYHTSGGHSGGEPVNVQVANAAETLSFLMWRLR